MDFINNNFFVGGRVVCINNGEENDTIGSPRLTIGKSYVIIGIERWQSCGQVFISIINDVGVRYGYYDYRFNGLRESRRMKLERIKKLSDGRR